MPEASRELTRLAGAALCVGFDGDRPENASFAELVELGPCGVVLFARNVTTSDATRSLVTSIGEAFSDAGMDEPLVCVDQEGGRVARVRFADGLPTMLALAATRDAELARRAGRRLARDLAQIGANLDFAPVLDLALAPGATVLGTRTLGDDPKVAAELGAALVRGLQDAGVGATIKHFPGHGESDLDPHVAFPRRSALGERDLEPFAAAIAAGVLAAMSAHVVVAGHAERPATIVPEILTGQLRETLGFGGVLFTDCLQMDAIARGVGTARAGVLALAAGADALIVSHDLALAYDVRDAIVAAVACGELSRVRLEEAVARTGALRAHLAALRARRESLAREEDDGIATEIARASIVAVRGDPVLAPERPLAIVSFEGATSDGIAHASAERPSLSLALRRHRFRTEYFRVPCDPDATMREMLLEVLGARRADTERQLIVLSRRAHLYREQRDLIAALLATASDAIAVSMLEPFDLGALAAASAILATCGDEAASIEALAEVLAGSAPARGTLPIRTTALA